MLQFRGLDRAALNGVRGDPYHDLEAELARRPELDWLAPLLDASRTRLADGPHGDLPRWQRALSALPAAEPLCEPDRAAPRLGRPVADPSSLETALQEMHPWRKGPFELGGVSIDSEWRSDRKWQRVAPHVDLRGETVLDVGCGNGYFGWRMLAAGARRVIGIDPTLLFAMQWQACRHFSGPVPNHVLVLGVEELPAHAGGFDRVFSMGVLYHRRDPHQHLRQLRGLVAEGGGLVLETLVLPEDDGLLEPLERYARMRNVHAVSGCGVLMDWLRRAGWRDARVVDVTPTGVDEQRPTAWMRFQSLAHALDPDDPERTVEGHPAPRRAVVIATG